MSKIWRVPVYWTVKAVVEIEADTLEKAIEIAQNDDGPLPAYSEYLDGSWEAGEDGDVEYVREVYNNSQENDVSDYSKEI